MINVKEAGSGLVVFIIHAKTIILDTEMLFCLMRQQLV